MSAPVENPVVAPEASPAEPAVPAAAEPATPEAPATEAKPAETPAEAAAETKAEEAPKADGEAAAAPVEEKKEEKPVEPIYNGALGYKAPGLKNVFRYSKKYFWFGEEAAVPTSSLTHYLRGEKAEIANPTAAWSSVTGKGLLFFAKHADQKETPAGVLNLSDASELVKDGTVAFHFKLHGGKHSFEAQTAPERNGWFVAFEKAIKDAQDAKEGIVSGESYKEELEKLRKPTTLAAPATGSTPKKSTEAAPKPAEAEASTAPATEATPARTGSSSSSSADEDKKKKKAKSKSRSASRKRASIFGTFLGKKDKVEEKVEEKKAEEKEEDKEAEATPAAAESSAAPAATEEAPKPVEETPAASPAEEKKAEEKPKPTKRGSIFGTFVEKLKSPTHEKKEADLVPAPKEEKVSAEAPKLDELPKSDDTPADAPAAPVEPVAAATDATAEAPKAEATPAEAKTPTTPAKEKQHFSFGKFLGGNKEKAKSPAAEKTSDAPKTEEAPKVEETTPAEAAAEPAAPAAETAEPKEETPAEGTAPAPKKRGSIFGALGGSVKKEKDGEEKPQGLKGLFRNASKAGRSKKDKEVAAPAKVDETAEPKEAAAADAATEDKKEPEAPAAPAEPAAIGDVVPDAVTVGQAPKSTPQVASTA